MKKFTLQIHLLLCLDRKGVYFSFGNSNMSSRILYDYEYEILTVNFDGGFEMFQLSRVVIEMNLL